VLGARGDDGEMAVIQLSTDHKVSLLGELARIEGKCGYVRPGRIDPDDGEFVPARMYEHEDRPWLGPGLCVSRSLGDLNALRCGLIPTPEVFSHVVRDEDNDEAVRIVEVFYNKGLPALDACRYLIAKAAVSWRRFEGEYRDDITAIVVYLDIVLQQLSADAVGELIEEEDAAAAAEPA
jgi:hypothetical protein